MRGLTSDVQAEEEERGLLLQKKVTGETLLQLKRVRVLSFPPPPPPPSFKTRDQQTDNGHRGWMRRCDSGASS